MAASGPNSPLPGGKWTVLGVCVFLVVAVFLVFGQTLRYGFVNYDDNEYVYENPQVMKGLTLHGIGWASTYSEIGHWHPLTWISHMLDCQIWGLNAGGHHLTNVFFHAANVVLLFLVLRRMMGLHPDKSAGAAATRAGTLWSSAFVAAVFALHPLRVESVAWVAERKDVLSGLFFLLTLGAYVRYVEKSKVRSPKSKVFYGLTLLFFVLGLLSKNMLVTLPFVLLLLDYWPLRRVTSDKNSVSQPLVLRSLGEGGSTWPRLILEKLPLFVLSAASCVATGLASETIPAINRLPLSFRIENALVSYVTYIRQMVYPAGLANPYPLAIHGMPLWKVAGSLFLLVAISLGVFALRKKRPYFVVGWLWYCGMLVPAIGIVQISYYAHADRYTYLPQIGLYIIIAWAARDLTFSWRYRRQVLGAGALVVIAALMVCAWKQTFYWRDSESLWRHTLACTTRNDVACNNLGNTVADQGRFAEAIEYLQRAIEINPAYAQAHNNLAAVLVKQGRPTEAIEQFQKAIQIKPDYADAYYNLGCVFDKQGRLEGAVEQFQKAIQISPDFAEAYCNLGLVFDKQGRSAEALGAYQKAIALNPDLAEAHHNLGALFSSQGRLDEAVEQFQKAIQLKPDYAKAYYGLAGVFGLQNQLAKAIEHYRKAIEIKPDYVDAHGNLANALAAQGQFDEALKEYQRTLELAPHSAQARFRFGQALQDQKRFAAAMAQYQKALELDPRHLLAHLNLAWLLATGPEASLRNGNRAVALARQAEQLANQGESPRIFDTLAAAYAEAGRFDEAVETAKRALNLPATQNNRPLAEAIQSRLKLYEAHSPYHEKP
jgi:tetratricopeptide (TPR) repeat protein